MANKIKVGINGFGRIGRVIARLALQSDDIEIVAINDLASPQTAAHLLKYDSVHGVLKDEVRVEGNFLHVGNRKIQLFAEKDPSALPWGSLGVTFVHECTGKFTAREKAALHLKGGAKRVILSGPSDDADAMFVMGVNDENYDPAKHVIVSNASCTTNCLAPVVKILDQNWGVVKGMMTTIHSYTNDQRILDFEHSDLRRARAGAVSMIPTKTGAAKAVGLVLPHLKGKIDGFAMRVPTPNVSVVDFVAELSKKATKEEVNAALKAAANGPLKGILGFEESPLVSCDFNGNPLSSIVDAKLTNVIGDNLVKVLAWYDNETGYSRRMIDLTLHMARKGL